MLGRVSGHDQVLEDSDEVGNQLLEVGQRVRTSLGHLGDEDDAGDQDAVVFLGQKRPEKEGSLGTRLGLEHFSLMLNNWSQ